MGHWCHCLGQDQLLTGLLANSDSFLRLMACATFARYEILDESRSPAPPQQGPGLIFALLSRENPLLSLLVWQLLYVLLLVVCGVQVGARE